jgi:hypothetical protein
MTTFTLFNNNADVRANRLIARQMGVEDAYEAAMEFFKEKRINKHHYVVIQKEATKPTEAAVFTNMFGEIPGLHGVSYCFQLAA